MSIFKIGERVKAKDYNLMGVVIETTPDKDWFRVKLDSPKDAISWVPDYKFARIPNRDNENVTNL